MRYFLRWFGALVLCVQQAAGAVCTAAVEREIDVSDCMLSRFYNPHDIEPLMYPDINARYFFIVVPVLQGEERKGAHFEIEGHFPHARYFSWTNYINGGGGLLDVIMDNILEPEEGINPTQKDSTGFAALTASDNGTNIYRLQIRDAQPDERSEQRPRNTLWGGFEGDGTEVAVNILGLRMYGIHPLGENSRVPPGADPAVWENQGQVPLPRIFYVIDDEEKAPYTTKDELCRLALQDTRYARAMALFLEGLDRLHDRLDPVLEQLDRGGLLSGADPPEWFIAGAPNFRKAIMYAYSDTQVLSAVARALPMYSFSLFLESNYYPNWNSGYLATVLNPDFGEVYVFRVKIPSFPHTEQGDAIRYGSWDPSGSAYEQDPVSFRGETFDQVRYWSVCIYKTYLAAVSNCIRDVEFKIDPDGFVTVAVSSREHKPAQDPLLGPDYNWIEWDSLIPYLGIREIYPHPGFDQGCFWYKTECEAEPDYANRNCHYDSQAISEVMGDFFPSGRYCSREEFETDRCGTGY